jgi:hypothetical protein
MSTGPFAYAGEGAWQTRLFLRAIATDLRLAWPVILLRGLPATGGSLRRFRADSCAGSARDEKKPAVVYAEPGDKKVALCRDFTGATGLEPATSGVTGRS